MVKQMGNLPLCDFATSMQFLETHSDIPRILLYFIAIESYEHFQLIMLIDILSVINSQKTVP